MAQIDLGLAPELLPGRTSLDAGRSWFTDKWGSVPADSGLDATGILTAASTGQCAVLFLLGADPLTDFPDPELAQAALDGAGLVIAIDPFINASIAHGADIVLPAAAFGEVDGTHTNIEGRITPVRQKVTPPGTARPDWMIAAEIRHAFWAKTWVFGSVSDITNEIASVSGLHAGADAAAIDAATDGVIVPLESAEVSGRPDVLVWTDRGAPTPAPAYDSYSFRLVVDRTMYDGGTQTTMCESPSQVCLTTARFVSARPRLQNLVSTPAQSCDSVRSEHRSMARSSSTTASPPVSLAVAHNHAGLDVRSLINMGELVTDVRIETV